MIVAVALAGCTMRLPPAVPAPPPRDLVDVPPPPPPPEKPGRVVVTDTSVRFYEPVRFAANGLDLTPGVRETLEQIASTLVGDPDILLVQVRGHADRAETDPSALAQQRADIVRAYLIAHGVDAQRLISYDAADAEPHGPIDDPDNRRIDLLVLDRLSD